MNKVFGWAVLAALVLGYFSCLSRPTLGVRPTPEAVFKPDTVSTAGAYPGTHTYEVFVRSNGPQRKVHLAGSCSCVDVLSPAGSFTLERNKPIKVRFTYTSPTASLANQNLLLVRDDNSEEIATLRINGMLQSIFKSDPAGIVLHRRVSNEEADTEIELQPRGDVTIDKATTDAGSLNIWLTNRIKNHPRLGIRMSGQTEDGTHQVPIAFEYKGKNFSGSSSLVMTYKVESDYSVVPNRIWLGKLKIGSPSTGILTINSLKDRANEIHCQAASPGLTVREKIHTASSVEVAYSQMAPDMPGLFGGKIKIYQGGDFITSIDVAGFAAR